jgi:hypothetical protein
MFQKPELGCSQYDGIPVTADLATAPVQFKLTSPEHDSHVAGLTQLHFDSRDYFTDEKRLHDIVIRAKLEADYPICFRGTSGDEDNRRGLQLSVIAEPFANVKSIGVRQHDVQQDQIRAVSGAEFNGTSAAMAPEELKALLLKVVFKERK